MKYVRLNECREVEEIFPYNPFEWIVGADGMPNREFLADCREVDDNVQLDYRWVEQPDGTYKSPERERGEYYE